MDPLTNPDHPWTPLSPAYLRMKRTLIVVVWGVELTAASLALGLLYRWWAGVALGVASVLWIAYRWHRQGRVYRAWGYAEHATDLYLKRGLLWRRQTVVPYGRMQVVNVNSGPIDRRYGLATVSMETASAGTDATIPGLDAATAEALRDRMTALGEQHAIGL